MSDKITYGVGAHEPIFHRMRTGNSTAEEWERWHYETSDQNIELLEKLGVTRATIACTKGFGLEAEKPLIERAARFAERAGKRGIKTHIYVQGFPVYYEAFLLETPQAEQWMARQQNGDYIPWGGQTFRRWIDPTIREFWDYQTRLLTYVLNQIKPDHMLMDNTVVHPSYTQSSRQSFRQYLRDKYQGEAIMREFGISSFDAVDLPHFDPIYWPSDAYRIVKDPLLQEWALWRSRVIADFCKSMRELVHRLSPGTKYATGCGCDGLRHNHLFATGVDFEERIAVTDLTHMEESWWRPGVVQSAPARTQIVMDERTPDQAGGAEKTQLRISTDSRWWKLYQSYGGGVHGGFWGENDRAAKLVALAHSFVFAREAECLGTIAPLAAAPNMFDDIRDVIDWGNAHISVLAGRQQSVCPIALWRGTATLAFIRHTPVWEACAVEQMLYENHLPFTILLDGGIERFLADRKLLILPGTQCVSDRQVELITRFVEGGGSLLLLGPSGTRDQRTRLRRKYAFTHLFGGAVPSLERFGPPHWVPELDWGAMPGRLSASYGKGKVALIKSITPRTELDLTRDPYSPDRQVMVKDILPPANEGEILDALHSVYGDNAGLPRIEAPRWTLCELWRKNKTLLICLANLWKGHDGGPVTIHFPANATATSVKAHFLLQNDVVEMPIQQGKLTLEKLPYFAALEVAW